MWVRDGAQMHGCLCLTLTSIPNTCLQVPRRKHSNCVKYTRYVCKCVCIHVYVGACLCDCAWLLVHDCLCKVTRSEHLPTIVSSTAVLREIQCVCVRACERACMCLRLRACVGACVRVCLRLWYKLHLLSFCLVCQKKRCGHSLERQKPHSCSPRSASLWGF